MHKLKDRIYDYLFVPKCAVCRIRMRHDRIGICERCRFAYEDLKAKYCDFCGMEASICTCIPHSLLINGCTDYRKLAFYSSAGDGDAVRSIVYAVKRRNPRALMRFMAQEMYALDVSSITSDTIVTFAPRTPQSVQQYGYDQGEVLAKNFAKESGAIFKPLLSRRRVPRHREQKLLNYKQRAENVHDMFSVKDPQAVRGKDILLIDDVVTSGATLGECMATLYKAGAKNVACRSIAYTYRKNKRKSD